VAETRRLRSVLFDLDGTFADTLADLSQALAGAMQERHLQPVTPEILRPLVSTGARAMARSACGERLDERALDTLVDRFLSLYAANVSRHTRMFDGMPALLDELGRRAMPWGIVTNKWRAFSEPLMRALDSQGRAGCIVSGDSTANAKPHPQPLLHACKLLGTLPAESVYVGDARNDVIAARRAGMRSVVALYGYIPADDDPRDWKADASIETPAELLTWIDAH
jgi:phosphoglycolate phosphatase